MYSQSLRIVLIGLTALLTLSTPLFGKESDAPLRDISNIVVDEHSLRDAVASRTLTWLTGSSSNNDYISVGRTANFFGFVGLRVASGQSLTRSDVANDTLAVLNTAQRDALADLLEDQKPAFKETQLARYQMNRALEGLLVGETISRKDFLKLGNAYGKGESKLGLVIAQRFGDVAQTLSPEQKKSLANIRSAHLSGRGHEIDRQKPKLKLSREDKQELVNIAARFLSWTTGTQAFNDFEVVGKPSQHFGFVSLRLESNHSVRRGEVAKEVWDILTPAQHERLNASAEDNIKDFEQFLNTRGHLMRTLEASLSGKTIDSEKAYNLGAVVGGIEASMTWAQAMAMLHVRRSMTDIQSADLLALRSKYVIAEKEMLPKDPVARGRQLFAQCVLCHASSENYTVGPSLENIVGRKIANDSSYQLYSPAIRAYSASASGWTESLLDKFLESPRSVVNGTTMAFTGLESAEDRAALITYLKSRE